MIDVVRLRAMSSPDADGGGLQSVLDGQLKCEQLTARRRLLTSLLALLSVPVWAMAAWPHLLDGPDRRFLLYLFGFVLALSCWAVVEEWRATSRLQRALSEQSPSPGWSAPDTPPAGAAPVPHPERSAAAGQRRR